MYWYEINKIPKIIFFDKIVFLIDRIVMSYCKQLIVNVLKLHATNHFLNFYFFISTNYFLINSFYPFSLKQFLMGYLFLMFFYYGLCYCFFNLFFLNSKLFGRGIFISILTCCKLSFSLHAIFLLQFILICHYAIRN